VILLRQFGQLFLKSEPEEHENVTGWWQEPSGSRESSRFVVWLNDHLGKRSYEFKLFIIFLLALGLRFYYIIGYRWNQQLGGDFVFYHGYAINIANFSWPANPLEGGPSAQHPPLFPFILAIGDRLGLVTIRQQVLENGFLGALAVFFIGFLGRKIDGPLTGLIASFIGAIYPGLWVYDGNGLSEATEVLFIVLIILFSYRFIEKPTLKRVGVLGAFIGLVTLARSEQILLLVFIGFYLIVRLIKGWKKKLEYLIVCSLCVFIVISPWVIRNMVTFPTFETLSTQLGTTLQTANCGPTYYGPFEGYWDIACAANVTPNEAIGDKQLQAIAFHYIRTHLSRLPVVMLMRLGRMWEVWHPFQQALFNVNEGWNYTASKMDLWSFWILSPFTIAGLVILFKRKVFINPLVSQIIMTTLSAILIYGQVRYRADSEIVWVLGSAVTVRAIFGKVGKRGFYFKKLPKVSNSSEVS
jgi:4-amino-4-deoxy-L-arabinose transferase-like glycosyltransferase